MRGLDRLRGLFQPIDQPSAGGTGWGVSTMDRRHRDRNPRIGLEQRQRDELATFQIGFDHVKRHPAQTETCFQEGVFPPEVRKPPCRRRQIDEAIPPSVNEA